MTDYLEILEDLLKKGLHDIECIRRDNAAFRLDHLARASTNSLHSRIAQAAHVLGAYMAAQNADE